MAATLSGTTSGEGTGGIPAEVRLWTPGDKGWTIDQEVIGEANGSYTFTGVSTGEYRISARMAPGTTGHFGDTWYDVEPPTSSGLFGSDADILEVTAGDTITGLDITLPITGGFQGVASGAFGPLSNIWARAESTTDRRHHHNDLTKAYNPRFGEFSYRGLRASHDFRMIIYDPQGRYETFVSDSTYSVTDGTYPSIGTLQLTSLPDDPYGSNNTAATGTDITLPFQTAGARIFPRGSDVDYFCLDVDDGDRLLARAESTFVVDGETRQHPWIDPILGFFTGDGDTLIQYNDDDPAGGTLAAFIDTGVLSAGRYCFVASTFGDQDFTGTGQQTAGPYDLTVEMGNRPPFMNVTLDGGAPPASLTVDEGDELVFTISFGDPDGDPVTPEITHEGSFGGDADGTNLTIGAGTATYTWTIPFDAAPESPYEITFRIDDGEFSEEVTVTVHVNAIQNPPSTPVPLWPIGGVHVDMFEVPLRIENSIDLDGDDLLYEFEVHEGPVAGDADQAASVVEDPTGETTFTTAPIAENTLVSWRVRAFDGDPVNGYSAWTDWQTFRIDTENAPPSTPQIVKPSENELVLVLTPRIASTVPIDPEEDPTTIVFELSSDADFDDLFAQSDAIPVDPDIGDRIEWTSSRTLSTGARYYVRARASDNRGGVSPWSDVVSFRTRPDEFLRPPQLAEDSGDLCNASFAPGEVPDSFTVRNIDESGDALSFELQILQADILLYEALQPQSDNTHTTIPMDASVFTDGPFTIRVRTVLDDSDADPSDWTSCDLSVFADETIDPDPSDPSDPSDPGWDGGGEAGCGCSSTTPGPGQAVWLLPLLFLFLRNRRRASTEAS